MVSNTLSAIIKAAQTYIDPQEVNCVVYHGPCNDGSGAALSAWLKLQDHAQYHNLNYHQKFPEEILIGKNVVVLDASFNKDHLLRLRETANKILILDHHYTARVNLAGIPGCFFAMQNSGAMLAWYYFHGLDATPPRLMQLIEDRDLWRWDERALSEPLYYGLKARIPDCEFMEFAPYLQEDKLTEIIDFGKSLVAENHRWCEQAALNVERRIFTLPGTNSRYHIMCGEVESDRLISELAEYLYSKFSIDFVMMWCKTEDGKYKVSFRANTPDINVADIAEALGGGGHKNAAGVVMTTSPWDMLQPDTSPY